MGCFQCGCMWCRTRVGVCLSASVWWLFTEALRNVGNLQAAATAQVPKRSTTAFLLTWSRTRPRSPSSKAAALHSSGRRFRGSPASNSSRMVLHVCTDGRIRTGATGLPCHALPASTSHAVCDAFPAYLPPYMSKCMLHACSPRVTSHCAGVLRAVRTASRLSLTCTARHVMRYRYATQVRVVRQRERQGALPHARQRLHGGRLRRLQPRQVRR